MIEFDKPLVTITQEEYNYLCNCREITEKIWLTYGPYDFPTGFYDYKLNDGTLISSKIIQIMNFDDSE